MKSLPRHGWPVPVLALVAETISSIYRTSKRTTEITHIARHTDDLLTPHDGELVLSGWPAVLLGPVGRTRTWLALALGDTATALAHLDSCATLVARAPAQLAWHR
ncbi:hypothetical protein [Nocardia gamkensis]|uniref:Uncharacterized protein n=1 Tax=Nocardia gamkensis TaxID=352869 RepID=A0A7X6L509_9NOCA|nr:hypothetical protein [Nocardia gamkensis]NKY27784.1 hypothetical protein [Nocardia gamkensis]